MRPWMIAAAVGAASTTAFARDDDDDDMVDNRSYALVPGDPDVPSGVGMALMIGGGSATALAGPDGADAAGTGGSWLARWVWGTRAVLAGELQYVGQAVPVNEGVTDAPGDATLLTNGGQVDLRLQAPIPVGSRGAVAPFLLGGFALLGHDVVGDDGGIDDGTSAGDRLTAHIPVGAGLALMTGGFIADARVAYRPTVGGDSPVFDDRTRFDDAVNGFGVTGSVGFEF